MRKSVYIITAMLVILVTSVSAEMKFGIAALGTWNYVLNSDFNDATKGKGKYLANLSGQKTETEQIIGDIGGELEIRLIPSEKLMIAIIPGYLDLPKSEFKVNKLPKEKYKFACLPISLGGYYVLKSGEKLNINLGLAVGLYMANLSYTSWSNTTSESANFKANGIGVGLRIFAEYKMSEKVALVGGLAGRYASIKGFKGDVKQTDGTTKEETFKSYDIEDSGKTYHVWYPLTEAETTAGKSDPAVKNLKDAALDLSGLNLYFGIAFNF